MIQSMTISLRCCCGLAALQETMCKDWPLHYLHFAPGTLWFGDMRFQTHKIAAENRAVTFTIDISRASLQNEIKFHINEMVGHQLGAVHPELLPDALRPTEEPKSTLSFLSRFGGRR